MRVPPPNQRFDIVLRYETIEIDSYGIATLNVYCDSVSAAPLSPAHVDAIETLAGKNFTITVGPDGGIYDKTQLINIIQEVGDASFLKPPDGRDPNKERVKDPDIVDDFTAIQWFLWDSLSSIETSIDSLQVGDKWKSYLPVPTATVVRPAREVIYKLSEIKRTDKGRIAVINSTYKQTDVVPSDWPPFPWSGEFLLTGNVGFFMSVFQGLVVVSLEGHGQELFNIDLGRIESSEQEYKVIFRPRVSPMPGTDPIITMEQKVKVQLLKD